MRTAITLAGISMLLASLLQADPATTQPGEGTGFTLSPPRVATLKTCTYLYNSTQTSYSTMGTAMGLIGELLSAMQADGVSPAGAMVLVYHDAPTDPTKTFTLDVGFPVTDGTAATNQYQVRKLESPRCMTAVYTGPISNIAQAYQQVLARIADAGETATSERHERYLYWEDLDSPNNVIQIEVVLQPKQ